MIIVQNPVVVMKRFELKYVVRPEQEARFLEGLRGHMEPDEYGKTSIASLYYDTPEYRLISGGATQKCRYIWRMAGPAAHTITR